MLHKLPILSLIPAAVAVIITFCTGIVLVPSLTTSIFSGQGGQAAFPGLSRFMRR